MSQYAWIQGRFKDGLSLAGQALEIAASVGDAEVRVLATYALGLNQCLLGAHREAITLFERVLDGPDTQIARRALAVTVPAYIGAACWHGYALTLVGEIDRALDSWTARPRRPTGDHPQAQAIAYDARYPHALSGADGHRARALRAGAGALRVEGALIWLPAAAGTWAGPSR
jgi:hypothetical protein